MLRAHFKTHATYAPMPFLSVICAASATPLLDVVPIFKYQATDLEDATTDLVKTWYEHVKPCSRMQHQPVSARSVGIVLTIESLNQVCTRKVMEERMAKVAATLGYESGFVKNLTKEDANGKKWDLSDLKTQNEAEEKLRDESPWLLALSLPATVLATKEVCDRTTFWCDCLGISAHVQVSVR